MRIMEKEAKEESGKNKTNRRRGVLLTQEGLEKLQTQKTNAEFAENKGNRYTLEALSERTGLSVDTCNKVLDNEIPVDKRTLKIFFQAFSLNLNDNDYYKPSLIAGEETTEDPIGWEEEPELPEGSVPLNSPYYVERSPIESDCYKAILQSGSLLRLKGPRRSGKTSLMNRILAYGKEQNYHTVYLSLFLADKSKFKDLDLFLQWFAATLTLNLDLPEQVTRYWSTLLGSKISCKHYFEKYILANLSHPLILGLDDVDNLFQYPDLADDFFSLLRSWHEESRNRDIWRKLRLIVAHSTEVYIPLTVNQSPFNVGLPLELREFTPEQVTELAARYQLVWTEKEVTQLINLVGGNPYLIRWALYHLYQEDVTLEEILNDCNHATSSIYTPHLNRQLLGLKSQPHELLEAYKNVILSNRPIDLDLITAFRLQSLGLVQVINNKTLPSCLLYHLYFRYSFESQNLS